MNKEKEEFELLLDLKTKVERLYFIDGTNKYLKLWHDIEDKWFEMLESK